MNKELAKTLTTALVQFIDRERPRGSMCCSNAECEAIENAFKEDNFFYVETLVERKFSGLTEFEEVVKDRLWRTLEYCETFRKDENKWAQELAAELLSLAREQFIKDGYVIEKKAFHDAVAKVDPEVMKEVSDNVDKENELAKKHLEGYIKGREDTMREMRDFIESQFNTQSGTLTATLHGNTSATDGKEHNPSFTD